MLSVSSEINKSINQSIECFSLIWTYIRNNTRRTKATIEN